VFLWEAVDAPANVTDETSTVVGSGSEFSTFLDQVLAVIVDRDVSPIGLEPFLGNLFGSLRFYF